MRSYLQTMSYLSRPDREAVSPTFTSTISRLSLFRNTGPEAQRDIARRLVMRKRSAGTMVIAQDEPTDSLFIIQRGRVKLAIYGEGGRQVTLDVLGAGEFFGELSAIDGGERGVSAVSLEDTTVLVLARDELYAHFKRFPTTAVAFLAEMSQRMRRMNELIANLALRDVSERIARTLVDLARDDGHEVAGCPAIRKRPTQQELANMVGSCRETVSRTLNGFSKKGLIRADGRSLLLSDELLSMAA